MERIKNFINSNWKKIVLGLGLILLVVFAFFAWSRRTKLPKASPPPGVGITITTDKTEYKQGEIVKITVRNGLDKPIWYTDFGCYPWWKLEKQEGENWQSIEIPLPTLTKYGEECIACPPPEFVEDVLEQLQPNSEVSKTWDLRKCRGETPMFINSGNYRLVFDYGFSKDLWNEKTIYSNEFTIK